MPLYKKEYLLLKAQINGFTQLANSYQTLLELQKDFSKQETLNKSLDKQIRKFKQLPFQDLKQAFSASIQDLQADLGILFDEEGNEIGNNQFGMIGQLEADRGRRTAQQDALRRKK